jgi:hypothetical protein
MPLTCSCRDDYDFYYDSPDFYDIFNQKRRKRCVSCGDLIDIGSHAGRFPQYEFDECGNKKYMASEWMCEICTDIFFILEDLGYCIVLGADDMKDLLGEYQAQSEYERVLKRYEKEKSKDWAKYPIRTKAYAIMGGYWIKTYFGWKWFNGDTFPTPGADVSRIEEPNQPAK